MAAIANAIERVNARQRKALKTRRNFDHDEAVTMLL
jgi:transposase-like protein